MSAFFSGEDSYDLVEEDEAAPMTLLSCLLYVIANITGMVLFWLYQQTRTTRLQQEQCDYVENSHEPGNGRTPTFWSSSSSSSFIFNHRQKKRTGSHSSLLSVLGLSHNGHRTFFAFEDRFYSFDEVGRACKKAGLDNCSLIVGVDFSASNEWQGRKCFAGQNLHRVVPGKITNPYQKVISIIGRTMEMFDEDNLIPAYGFGDSITTNKSVFPFREGEEPCKGFAHVLDCYCEISTRITLGGPTNLAPIIHKAVDIVKLLKKYHILIIIADGQVTEHTATVDAIVEASLCPLSIILIGVGDGPWDTMEQFDDSLPERNFDNFQFVNYHATVRKNRKSPEASFALHAMMEIPDQFKTIKSLGYLDNCHHGNQHNNNNNNNQESDGGDAAASDGAAASLTPCQDKHFSNG